jgi:Tol biopolymer transport system component
VSRSARFRNGRYLRGEYFSAARSVFSPMRGSSVTGHLSSGGISVVRSRVVVRFAFALALVAGTVSVARSADSAPSWSCGAKTFMPAWSHNGRELAFVCGERTPQTVAIVDVASGRTRRVVGGSIDTFSWSPDGRRIAYGDLGVFTTRIDGSRRRRIVSTMWAGFPLWSPDGREILFSRPLSDELDHWYVISATGGKSRAVATAAFSSSPAWSPDSTRIAFERAVGAGASHPASGSQIAVVPRSGKGLRVLTKGEGDRYRPSWSPNGEQIAFEKNGSVVVMHSDGTDAHVLTRGTEPQFAPNGNKVLYSSRGLATFGLGGEGVRQLTKTEGDRAATWSPDGRLIAFVRNSSIWVVRADGTHARRVVP